MKHEKDIYAVLWVDFQPFTLKFDSKELALEKAEELKSRFEYVRAVVLTADNKLIDLTKESKHANL